MENTRHSNRFHDYRVDELSFCRQRILEAIREGDPKKASENARYWMEKICGLGYDIQFTRDTSQRILEEVEMNINKHLLELQSLYADTSYYF